MQTELTKIINQLRKSISIEAKMDGLRYDTLKETCKGIARTSKALREDVD